VAGAFSCNTLGDSTDAATGWGVLDSEGNERANRAYFGFGKYILLSVHSKEAWEASLDMFWSTPHDSTKPKPIRNADKDMGDYASRLALILGQEGSVSWGGAYNLNDPLSPRRMIVTTNVPRTYPYDASGQLLDPLSFIVPLQAVGNQYATLKFVYLGRDLYQYRWANGLQVNIHFLEVGF
jgi:hypothetical protein